MVPPNIRGEHWDVGTFFFLFNFFPIPDRATLPDLVLSKLSHMVHWFLGLK